MKTTTKTTVPTMTVTQQGRICADWFQRMIRKEFDEAEGHFQRAARTEGYATAYERSAARLLRAEMQATMLRPIADACQSDDPMNALDDVKKEFQLQLIETVKRNDGSPEEHRVKALRAECQGWALQTIEQILHALRDVRA